jgi:hypothetical protein
VAVLALAGLAVFGLAGCGGDDGPPRYDVSGEVTFQGKPVPVGRIAFEPDTSQGNTGPAGFAEIHDGHYDTAETGKGPVGGPHTVVIDGFDGKPAPENQNVETGSPLFFGYRVPMDLPKETTTKDFDVPATAAAH